MTPATSPPDGQAVKLKIHGLDVVREGDEDEKDEEPLTARLDAAAARAEQQKAALSAASGQAWGTEADKSRNQPEAGQLLRTPGGLSPTAEIELPGDNELVSIWADTESIVTLRARCAELESEGFELRERIVEYEAAEQVRSGQLEEECASMVAQAKSSAADEISDLQQQLADVHAAEDANTKAKAEDQSKTAAEISSLRQQVADLQVEATASQAKSEAEKTLARAEAERTLLAENTNLRQQLGDLRTAAETSSKAKAEVESKTAEEIKNLREELAVAHAAETVMARAKKEAETTLAAENASLREQLLDAQEAKGAVSQAKDEATSTLVAENFSLRQQLNDLRVAEEANSKAKAEADSTMAADMASLRQQIVDLKKLKAASEAATAAELETLRQQLIDSAKAKSEAESSAAAAAAEISSLHQQLAEAESVTAEISSLHQQLADLRAAEETSSKAKAEAESKTAEEIKSLREQLAIAHAAEGVMARAKKETESSLSAENANLRNKLDNLSARSRDKEDADSSLAAENLNLQNQLAALEIQAEEEKRQQEAEVAELRQQIRAQREIVSGEVASSPIIKSAVQSPLASPVAASSSRPSWRAPDAEEENSAASSMNHERQRAGVQFPPRRNVRWYDPQENAQQSREGVMNRSASCPAQSPNMPASKIASGQADPSRVEVACKSQQDYEGRVETDEGFRWKDSTDETQDWNADEGSGDEALEDEDEAGSLGSEGMYDERDAEADEAIEELEKFGEEDSEVEGEESQEEQYEDEGLWTAGEEERRTLSAVEEEEDPYDSVARDMEEEEEEEEMYTDGEAAAEAAGLKVAADSKSTFSDKVHLTSYTKFRTNVRTPDGSPSSIQVPIQAETAPIVNRASLQRLGLRPTGNATVRPGMEGHRTHSMSPDGRPNGESKTPPVPKMPMPRAGSPNAYTTLPQGRVLQPSNSRTSPNFGSPRQSGPLRAPLGGSAVCSTGKMPSPGATPADVDSARAATPSARTLLMQTNPLRPATGNTTSTPILHGVSTPGGSSGSSGANPNEAPAPGLLASAGAVASGSSLATAAATPGSAIAPGGAVASGAGPGGVRVAQAVRSYSAMVTPVKQRPEDIGRPPFFVSEGPVGMPVRNMPSGGPPGKGSVPGERGVATPPQCQPRLAYAGVAAVRPANWPPPS